MMMSWLWIAGVEVGMHSRLADIFFLGRSAAASDGGGPADFPASAAGSQAMYSVVKVPTHVPTQFDFEPHLLLYHVCMHIQPCTHGSAVRVLKKVCSFV